MTTLNQNETTNRTRPKSSPVNTNCVFKTTVLYDKWHYHVCGKCGTRRLSPPDKPFYVVSCPMWYKGLGSRLHWALGKAGITPERWAAFTGKPCRCKERQSLLDRIVPWL